MVQELAEPSRDPLLTEFVERFESAVDDRYLLQHGLEVLSYQLLDTYRFYSVHRTGDIKVRIEVLDPDHSQSPQPGEPRSETTLIEILTEDHPFVIDTIALFLNFAGLRTHSSCFVALRAHRDSNGELKSFSPHREPALSTAHLRESGDGLDTTRVEEDFRPGEAGANDDSENGASSTLTEDSNCTQEVLGRFEVTGRLDTSFQEQVKQAIESRLSVARLVVDEFRGMKSALRELARNHLSLLPNATPQERGVIEDVRDLVGWILQDNFILIGMSFYQAESPPRRLPERGLGYQNVPDEDLQEVVARTALMRTSKRKLIRWVNVYKSQEESLIHRAGKIDNFIFRGYSASGELIGFYHLRGLFTFKAIQTLGGQVPFIRLKLLRLLEEGGFMRGSLHWKAYSNAFNSIPIEYLFEAHPVEIAKVVNQILLVEKEKELRTHIVIDRRGRKGLYFLVLPRQGYSEDLRSRVEQILLEGLGATYSDSRVYFGKFDTVLLTFFFTTTQDFKLFETKDIDEKVRRVAGTWENRFSRALEREVGKEQAARLLHEFRQGFSSEYQFSTPPEEAAVDVLRLEKLTQDSSREIGFSILQSPEDQSQEVAKLRVYLELNVYLSSLLPVLDNFGLHVIDQAAYRLEPANGPNLFVQSFRIAGIRGPDHPVVVHSERIIEALEMVFMERVDNDVMNRLVIEVGLSWQDVLLIRAYANYMRQLRIVYTFNFMSTTLREYPHLTKQLVNYYQTRFSPSLNLSIEERERRAKAISEEFIDGLQSVPLQSQDNFLRRMLNLFEATLRTSRYQCRSPEQAERLSFKVDPDKLVVGSDPKPWREIFVHHYSVEGVHLRGGRLARGGLRWSDRIGDYREEILGLMRTQMVKNVLIVPVGAKGGFVVRRPADDRDLRRKQADDVYRIYINALLDITDNVVNGIVVRPDGVISYDEEDPYLVVAADKGTAHLSDTANAISLERGFWLGDAFASGGKNGYDHKALGITARGTWESVKRHFREVGTDPERDPITVVGIGDMSGDVFGNGLLLSRSLQLVAAFNHLHIFIDPDPDPKVSFEERKRLFELERSTWRDYDEAKLSDGGGIYERHAKLLDLSGSAQKLLGLSGRYHRPDDVIRSMLTMRADMLWNGGIGTYIRGSKEDDRDVGDLANSSVRVDARQVRVRVIGEGGNLGVTQAGRIELALAGCRLNTDFVDNSAGVNCSDHEVNLKILLEDQLKTGEISVSERNQILENLAEEVCRSVLRYNYEQTLMVSLDERRSRRDPFSFERTIKSFEDRGLIVRKRDYLPTVEQLTSRAGKSQGLARPELCTLGAFAKMEVYRKLLETKDLDIPSLEDYFTAYFPDLLVSRFSSAFPRHLLHREITMTVITNLIVDHAGATFFSDVIQETGVGVAEIVRAYLLVDELFQFWGMKESVLALDGQVPADVQYDAILRIEEAIRRSVAWVLGGETGRLARVEAYRPQYTELLKAYESQLPQSLAEPEQRHFKLSEDIYYGAGFTIGLPVRLARITYLPAGLRIVDICFLPQASVPEVTKLYFRIGQLSQIFPLVRTLDDHSFLGRWESLMVRMVRNSLLDSLWSLTNRVVRSLRDDSIATKDWTDEGMKRAEASPYFEEIRLDIAELLREDLSTASLPVVAWRLSRGFGS